MSITPDGKTIVVGAPNANVGPSANQGKVFVFTEPTSGWGAGIPTMATLDDTGGQSGDNLGQSVSISPSGATIAAGVPHTNLTKGGAVVFLIQGTSWNMPQTTPQAHLTDNATGVAQLGEAVAATDDRVVVGGWGSNNLPSFSGETIVFSEPGTGWANASSGTFLVASNASQGDFYGTSAAISPDDKTIAVGSDFHQIGNGASGTVYVFSSADGTWTTDVPETARLTASDIGGGLGHSVAIEGSVIVAGAPFTTLSNHTGQGAVYVFTMPAGGWKSETQAAKLGASDGAQGDTLGESVGISNATILAAAPFAKGAPLQLQGQGFLYAFASVPSTRVAFSPGSPDGLNGWYTHAVHVTVSASDLASTISATRCALDPSGAPGSFGGLPSSCAFAGGGANVSSDGQHTLYAASMNAAGYAEPSTTAWPFRIDATHPTVKCLPPPRFPLGDNGALVGAKVTDRTSGPAANTAVARANVKSAGKKTVRVTGHDLAGNSTTVKCKYTVIAPKISGSLTWTDTFRPPPTVFNVIVALQMPRGSQIAMTCRGGGCPFSRRTVHVASTRLVCKAHHKHCKRKPAPAHTDVGLGGPFSGRHLAAGTRLTFSLTAKNTVGLIYSLLIKAGAPPSSKTQCLAPGSHTPGKGC